MPPMITSDLALQAVEKYLSGMLVSSRCFPSPKQVIIIQSAHESDGMKIGGACIGFELEIYGLALRRSHHHHLPSLFPTMLGSASSLTGYS